MMAHFFVISCIFKFIFYFLLDIVSNMNYNDRGDVYPKAPSRLKYFINSDGITI